TGNWAYLPFGTCPFAPYCWHLPFGRLELSHLQVYRCARSNIVTFQYRHVRKEARGSAKHERIRSPCVEWKHNSGVENVENYQATDRLRGAARTMVADIASRGRRESCRRNGD